MANNLIEIMKKKIETPDQTRLSATDRALLEQTCKYLEEIKNQRVFETTVLTELKELIQSNPELFAEEVTKELTKLHASLEQNTLQTKKLAEAALSAASNAQKTSETALQTASDTQKATEAALLQSAVESQKTIADAQTIQKNERRLSSLTCLCWFSLLTTLGTMALLILNILDII